MSASVTGPPWLTAISVLPSQLLTVKVLRPPVESAQYTAIRFTQRLDDAAIRPSMGSVGDSLDNALAENFFSTLKVELVYRTSFRTREEADLELFRYIDGWYNPTRIQKALGWRSPDEDEAAYWATLAAQPASSTIHADATGNR